ncbi:hypothetical protein EVAR_9216_1 [Eumeta japonica]|uniref:FLYWCH-type domain-containing protein n=1 Tax=Eumeta variegata TaxID=151549 RepID=A0A4C1WQC7_EUMVA|nr:hypothetical protein EVAR_9216_1 [Eumeta japonica]
MNGYTYYQHKQLKDGHRWSCTQMGSRSCRAYLHVTPEKLVIRAHIEHTHPPSTYFLEKIKKQHGAQFYQRPNGRINLRLNNYTYYKHMKARTGAHRWSCTAYGSKWKCRAHLIITDNLEVLRANILHTHPPHVYRVDENGRHIRVMHRKGFVNGQGGFDRSVEDNVPVPKLIPKNQGPQMQPCTSYYDHLIPHSIFNHIM